MTLKPCAGPNSGWRGRIGLRGAADGKKSDSLSFDQLLKNGIGQNGPLDGRAL